MASLTAGTLFSIVAIDLVRPLALFVRRLHGAVEEVPRLRGAHTRTRQGCRGEAAFGGGPPPETVAARSLEPGAHHGEPGHGEEEEDRRPQGVLLREHPEDRVPGRVLVDAPNLGDESGTAGGASVTRPPGGIAARDWLRPTANGVALGNCGERGGARTAAIATMAEERRKKANGRSCLDCAAWRERQGRCQKNVAARLGGGRGQIAR